MRFVQYLGIGAIPDAALAALTHHKDLGIHTEMFSDGVLDLIKCNAITNSKKTLFPGRVNDSIDSDNNILYIFIFFLPPIFCMSILIKMLKC